MKKKELGQFMSTNKNLISRFVDKVKDEDILIDPFSGHLDLLQNFKNNFIAYDLDPHNDSVIQRDSLLNPPYLKDAFVITNPPYLNINKTENKTVFHKYQTDDLYKAAMKMLINQEVEEGIIIIPSSFWFNINARQIRKDFLSKYRVEVAQIFNHRTFEDTSYGVSSFYFKRDELDSQKILIEYPDEMNNIINSHTIQIGSHNNYSMTEDISSMLLRHPSKIKITRYISATQNPTNIYLHTIDTSQPIRVELKDHELGLKSDRAFLTFAIDGINITKEDEVAIVDLFNIELNKMRELYNDFFLSNYRENGRKRMTFTFAYRFMEHILAMYYTMRKT